jgi:hypothetical protein
MKVRIMLARNPKIIPRIALTILAALAFSGCTSISYKSREAANAPKPDDYPIPFYSPEQTVPRPCRVIGTVTMQAGKFAIFGGSANAEMQQVMHRAHQAGADAVKLTGADKPDFANPNSRMAANLLRYTDVWETVGITQSEFQTYLRSPRQALDPIEGVWVFGGMKPHTIGIARNKEKPGREFVAFILNSTNPVWPAGTKKMDIRHGLEPGSYELTYYLGDFTPVEVPILLKHQTTFTFLLENNDEDGSMISYAKL